MISAALSFNNAKAVKSVICAKENVTPLQPKGGLVNTKFQNDLTTIKIFVISSELQRSLAFGRIGEFSRSIVRSRKVFQRFQLSRTIETHYWHPAPGRRCN